MEYWVFSGYSLFLNYSSQVEYSFFPNTGVSYLSRRLQKLEAQNPLFQYSNIPSFQFIVACNH